MGVESHARLGSGALLSMGTQRELTNVRGAQLHLIDGEESVLMTNSDFSLKLLKQSNSPLAVVVASVGELQWPIGKDAPVLRVWNRRYTFALPGLIYGLILPDSTQVGALQHLESILAEYSTFETHHEIANSVQFAMNGRRNDPGFWTAVALEVETLSSRIARNIDSASTIVANSTAVGEDWAALDIKQGMNTLTKRKDSDRNKGALSPRIMKRMQQARRMSAVTKLLSRTLVKGAISATGHVTKSLGFDMNGTRSGPIYGVESTQNAAMASVDAFGKVVEAVETAGKSLSDSSNKVGNDSAYDRFGAEEGIGSFGDAVNSAWTLNKVGLRMLLRLTAASTALTSRSGTAKSASSSVTSLRGDQSVSTGSTRNMKQSRSSPDLQHEISLSPLESAQQPAPQTVAWNLIPSSGQPLHTSQFFSTSAEQMRNKVARLPSPTHSFMPAGNFSTIATPLPRPNSPFQQYHNQHLPQAPLPFSFQPQANLQME